MRSDFHVYICTNCLGGKNRLEHQWRQDGNLVSVTELPCSGKVDAQYMMRALESGVKGVTVITCPRGECELVQGNSRAQVRVRTVKRLLKEIGSDPDKVQLVQVDDKNLRVEALKEVMVESVESQIGPSVNLPADSDESMDSLQLQDDTNLAQHTGT